jgi:hypothetical protein
MLLEAGIFLSTYVGMRLFNKLREKETVDKKNAIVAKESHIFQHSFETKQMINDTIKKVHEHKLKVSIFSLGVSVITTQFFYPNLALFTVGLYIYSFH